MKALVLIAHGSRRQASNEEVTALSRMISNRMSDDFPIIEAGFLELAEPSILNAVDRCVQQGATHISILPYFLSAGRHVQHDIPSEINNAKAVHPDISMVLLPHIGGSPRMIELVRGSVMSA